MRAKQEATFHRFDPNELPELLGLASPLFLSKDAAFRQLRYVAKYVKPLGCASVAIERHYIDRDFMEDYSVFYSKDLDPPPNHCQRVHFFSLPVDDVLARIETIVLNGANSDEAAYRSECKQFSDEAYLGFSVVKPLPGSPVGRTVLKPYPEQPNGGDAGSRREFKCSRPYQVHFRGVELSVDGLAFQQQDAGVSACATTAIWSALQKARYLEEIRPATPAQITALASEYALPFGRAMPSEGLSVGQMCQAVEAAGASPALFRISDFETGRGLLYSATKSGIAPILILERSPDDRLLRHAVTVAGMRLRSPRTASRVANFTDDVAGDLIALYVHDDRRGAYLRADVKPDAGDQQSSKKKLTLTLGPQEGGSYADEKWNSEDWNVVIVLIPIHAKIRLTFSDLRRLAVESIIPRLHAYRDGALLDIGEQSAAISFETWIERAYRYVEDLFLSPPRAKPAMVTELCQEVSLSRYLGVVRIQAEYCDPIDVLVDTTSTYRNGRCLAVIVLNDEKKHTMSLARFLHKHYKCSLIEDRSKQSGTKGAG